MANDSGFLPAVTADSVALLAGVSKSAVSRAFTDGASIAPATRELVHAAALKLGYRPNPIARSLTTKRSAIIGVAMGYMDQLYAPILQHLSERLTAEGLRLLLFKANPTIIADAELENILRYNVDALLLASVKLSDGFAQRCRQARIPIVLINPTRTIFPISSVTGADCEGGRQLGDLLVRGGHQRFAFMAGHEASLTGRAREDGFEEALAAVGAPRPSRVTGNYTFEGGLIAARQLLKQPLPPDAIFCANDSMACATIDVARREFGRVVGSDISIVGFDDEAMASWPGFDLTTFSVPIGLLVDQTIDLMGRLWKDPDDDLQITIPGKLIVRRTVREAQRGMGS